MKTIKITLSTVIVCSLFLISCNKNSADKKINIESQTTTTTTTNEQSKTSETTDTKEISSNTKNNLDITGWEKINIGSDDAHLYQGSVELEGWLSYEDIYTKNTQAWHFKLTEESKKKIPEDMLKFHHESFAFDESSKIYIDQLRKTDETHLAKIKAEEIRWVIEGNPKIKIEKILTLNEGPDYQEIDWKLTKGKPPYTDTGIITYEGEIVLEGWAEYVPFYVKGSEDWHFKVAETSLEKLPEDMYKKWKNQYFLISKEDKELLNELKKTSPEKSVEILATKLSWQIEGNPNIVIRAILK